LEKKQKNKRGYKNGFRTKRYCYSCGELIYGCFVYVLVGIWLDHFEGRRKNLPEEWCGKCKQKRVELQEIIDEEIAEMLREKILLNDLLLIFVLNIYFGQIIINPFEKNLIPFF